MGRSFLIFILCCFTFSVFGAPKFGTYFGILHHNQLKQDQLAKLDFVVSRNEGNQMSLVVILTLHFGDYTNKEYITYHYDKVKYNPVSGNLYLTQDNQGLTISSIVFDEGQLVADVSSVWTGTVGKLSMKLGEPVSPQFPLIEPLWGEYRGYCGNRNTAIQLYTYRSNDELSGFGHPFAAYAIKGHQAWNKGISPSEKLLVLKNFIDGSYDFYRGDLELSGVHARRKCKVTSIGLICEIDGATCALPRVSSETKGKRTLAFPSSPRGFGFTPDTLTAEKLGHLTSGEYKGYVHHEYLDEYQLASLTINLLRSGPQGGLQISATARLFFGDERESIPYQFSDTFYPNPVGKQVILLNRPNNDVDAAIHITSVRKDVIQGTWYSFIFGKVGTFELRKDRLPTLPNDAKIMEPLGGLYESSQWDLDLSVRAVGQGVLSTENPFYPNTFNGLLTLASGVTTNLAFSSGSYDFYTGRIGFMRTPGEGRLFPEAVYVGQRVHKRKFRLKRIILPITNELPDHESFDMFRLSPRARRNSESN